MKELDLVLEFLNKHNLPPKSIFQIAENEFGLSWHWEKGTLDPSAVVEKDEFAITVFRKNENDSTTQHFWSIELFCTALLDVLTNPQTKFVQDPVLLQFRSHYFTKNQIADKHTDALSLSTATADSKTPRKFLDLYRNLPITLGCCVDKEKNVIATAFHLFDSWFISAPNVLNRNDVSLELEPLGQFPARERMYVDSERFSARKYGFQPRSDHFDWEFAEQTLIQEKFKYLPLGWVDNGFSAFFSPQRVPCFSSQLLLNVIGSYNPGQLPCFAYCVDLPSVSFGAPIIGLVNDQPVVCGVHSGTLSKSIALGASVMELFIVIQAKYHISIPKEFDDKLETYFAELSGHQVKPTTPTQIQLLEKHVIQLERSENVCRFCLEKFGELDVFKLQCGHLFHSKCILPWFNLANTCPLCRKLISD